MLTKSAKVNVELLTKIMIWIIETQENL